MLPFFIFGALVNSQEKVDILFMENEKFETEEFKVSGEDLLKKVKELIHQGNIRRIIIKNEEGKPLIEIPVTVGVLGALLLPVFAAVGAIAAIVTKCTVVVVKDK